MRRLDRCRRTWRFCCKCYFSSTLGLTNIAGTPINRGVGKKQRRRVLFCVSYLQQIPLEEVRKGARHRDPGTTKLMTAETTTRRNPLHTGRIIEGPLKPQLQRTFA